MRAVGHIRLSDVSYCQPDYGPVQGDFAFSYISRRGPPHGKMGLAPPLETTHQALIILQLCLQHSWGHILPVHFRLIFQTLSIYAFHQDPCHAEVMPRSKSIADHPRRDEWGPHRRELSRLFIVEGVAVADIAKYMRQKHGFDKKSVRLAQLAA